AGADITIFKYGLPPNRNAKCMSAVINYFESATFGNLVYSFYRTRISINMGRQNPRGFRCDSRLYFFGIDVTGGGINVNKNRLASLPYKTACCGNVRKRCRDDFALKTKCLDRQLYGYGTIRDKEQVFYVEIFF